MLVPMVRSRLNKASERRCPSGLLVNAATNGSISPEAGGSNVIFTFNKTKVCNTTYLRLLKAAANSFLIAFPPTLAPNLGFLLLKPELDFFLIGLAPFNMELSRDPTAPAPPGYEGYCRCGPATGCSVPQRATK